MSHCNAFTYDLNPCLTTCQGDVCDEHTNFYNPDIWFERFIFSVDRLHYVFSSAAKIQLIYKKAVLDGRIQITRDHFRDLDTSQNPASLVDYYLLCCKQPGVDPLWSIMLFMLSIKTILDMHRPGVHDVVLMNRHLLDRFLDPLFNTKPFDMIMAQTFFHVLANDRHRGIQNIDHPTVSLFQYIKSHPKYTELLWKHSYHEENLVTLIHNSRNKGLSYEKVRVFLADIPAQRLAHYAKCREQNQALREEIAYAVWNPAWYLDHEEYKDLMVRWSIVTKV